MTYPIGMALSLCAISTMPAFAAPSVSVSQLRCENVLNPVGVEEAHPRLSWQLASSERDVRQSAYRVLVASRLELLAKDRGDLWDSGRIKSNATNEILYKGKSLDSRTKCYWKVCAWDNKARHLPFSAPAEWQMGLLHKSDWHGEWIGYVPPEKTEGNTPTLQAATWVWYPEGDPLRNAPEETRYFRHTFNLAPGKPVSSARLRIAADNTAIIFVNGREVGRSHDSWKSRDVFDVAPFLVPGANVIAVSVANEGTAAGLAAQMDVVQDEQTLTVISNGTWRSSKEAPTGWQTANFDDAAWSTSKEVAKVGEGPWGTINNSTESSPAPHLRRTFEVKSPVDRATLYICGLGYNELYINGRKVGDHMLDPGWTRYDRRSLYVSHDVTPLLKNGQNALGVILRTGHYDDHVLAAWNFDTAPWRTPPKMLVELRLDYADGRTQTVTSDGNWKAATGPIVFDSISAGETYDARLEKAGWDTPNYNDSAWQPAQVVEPVKGLLTSQISPPIRIVQSITPVKVTQPKPGVWLFDLGQNIAGIPQLHVTGPAGTRVVMKCAEKLHPDGTLDASSLDKFVRDRDQSQQFQTDTYILKGGGREVWNPRFTYHGFQYVEVTGFPGSPSIDNIRGLVMHTDFAPTGTFECSNPLLNKIQQMSYLNPGETAGVMGRVNHIGTGYGTIPKGNLLQLGDDGTCSLVVVRGKVDKKKLVGMLSSRPSSKHRMMTVLAEKGCWHRSS